ncbi:MAG: ATP-binding protein [Egibacteraceae bacterium]
MALCVQQTPALLVVRADEHLNDLMRELELIRLGTHRQTTSSAPPARLLELVDQILTRYAGARLGSRQGAEEALAQGHSTVDLDLALPPPAAEAGEHFLGLLEELHDYAREGVLLTVPPPQEVVDFQRRWVEQVVALLRAGGGAAEYTAPDPVVEDMPWEAPEAATYVHPTPLESPLTRWLSVRPDLGEIGRVRQELADQLTTWGRRALTEAVALPASELVANAVLHTRSECDVGLLVSAELVRLVVRDRSEHLPVWSSANLATVSQLHGDGEDDLDDLETFLAATGRGLGIVAAVSDRWGVEPHPGAGKSVWFELDVAKADQLVC